MFKELHAMATAATLLITASAEGDQLRISVTPTYPDGKVPAGVAPLRPLSLVGSPEELDADFATVLTFWQAPKRSLMEQAQAAADGAEDDAGAKATGKPAETKPKAKPGRKPGMAATQKADAAGPATGEAGPGAEPEVAGSQAGGDEVFALTGADSNDAGTPAAPPASAPAPESGAPAADTFTIDLF
ncbi:MAG: PRTRC system protein E [Telluria sp.]